MITASIAVCRLPDELRQLAEHLARALAPFVAEGGEIRVAMVEAAPSLYFERVAFVANEVDRHAYREVAAHRRIERYQHAFGGVRKGRCARDHAVDDRLPVLGLAGLEEGRVGARFDEIALGVD